MSVSDEIEKLEKLRDRGTISPEEFEQQKAILLSQGSSPPVTEAINTTAAEPAEIAPIRRWGPQLGLMFVFSFLGVLVTFFFPAYQKKDGKYVRVGKLKKATFQVLAVVVNTIVVSILSASQGPHSGLQSSAPDTASGGLEPTATAAGDGLPACDTDDTKASVKQIVEQNNGVDVLDMGEPREISCPALNNTDGSCLKTGEKDRFCNVQLALNSGTISARFHMYFGPSGKLLIEVQEGSWADWSKLK